MPPVLKSSSSLSPLKGMSALLVRRKPPEALGGIVLRRSARIARAARKVVGLERIAVVLRRLARVSKVATKVVGRIIRLRVGV